jgi:hypothetical protein
METLDTLAKDAPALIGLALLVGAIVWLVLEIQRLRESIEPIATSPIVRGLAGIR